MGIAEEGARAEERERGDIETDSFCRQLILQDDEKLVRALAEFV